MQSFIEKRDGLGDINPHGPSSPRRPGVITGAVAGSTSSPLDRKKSKTNVELTKPPIPPFDESKPEFENLKPPGTPKLQRSASQHQDDAADPRSGWESAPPFGQHYDGTGGLRERWEEQSNLHSLLSESAATRPTSRQTGGDLDDDNQSTQSDVLGDRPRSHQGRNGHKVSGSSNFVGRTRNKLQIPGRRPYIDVKDGKFSVPGHDTADFGTSLITHAPRNSMPENSIFRQDPFETTSEEVSPRPGLNPRFLHSSFPYRQGGLPKMPTHIERAAFHVDAVRKLSPENVDELMGAGHRRTYPRSGQEPSMQYPVSSFYVSNDDHLLADLESNDGDLQPQEDESEQQQRTPKAMRKKVAVQDATIALDPLKPKPTLRQKPHRTVTLQDAVLSGSPIERLPTNRQSTPNKRCRSIDYDDAALKRMNFAELQNEPFDHDPTREVAQSPAKPPADNLVNRLGFFGSKDENVQTQFFTQMSVRDWEDSGDWFLEQFGNIVNRMRDARQAKRKVVDAFELEVSSREEAVRHKKESIDRRLSKLRQDGDAMMKGKELDE